MDRYRITTQPPDGAEQTWVLLPDLASARMQAEEHARQEKNLHVRLYHEVLGGEAKQRELILDLPPKDAA